MEERERERVRREKLIPLLGIPNEVSYKRIGKLLYEFSEELNVKTFATVVINRLRALNFPPA